MNANEIGVTENEDFWNSAVKILTTCRTERSSNRSNPIPVSPIQNLDIYIYKNSIKTADIGLTAFVGDSPTKFEIWFRKRKPGDTWTLQSMNEEIKNTWADEISKLLWKQAKRNRGKLINEFFRVIDDDYRTFVFLSPFIRNSNGRNVINGNR